MINQIIILKRTEISFEADSGDLEKLIDGLYRAIRETILNLYTEGIRELYKNTEFIVTIKDPDVPHHFKVRILLPPFFHNEKKYDKFLQKLQELLGKYSSYAIA